MAISESDAGQATSRLLTSRMRILTAYPFYGLLLMHMRYGLDWECPTAYTDGDRIMFSPAFLSELSDRELDFVMMHEIMHVVLMHCVRMKGYDPTVYTVAADIVVNSNILKSMGMRTEAITLRRHGEAMHKAPGGKEGYEYTAEEVYELLLKSGALRKGCGAEGDGGEENNEKNAQKGGAGGTKKGKNSTRGGASAGKWRGFDDHRHWKNEDSASSEELRDVWAARVLSAAETVRISEQGSSRGTVPLGAQRLLEELTKPRANWRQVLAEFVREEINDYSFSPPDRRFSDSGFFLPDFNDSEQSVRDLLFFIDTSGSMPDGAIAAAYSEIAGAIEQFGGKLSGRLGFFDAELYEPVPFDSVEDVLKIRPKGGGGTDFELPFAYLRRQIRENTDSPPCVIIIMTDGYAPFPHESAAMGTPTLWAMTTDEVPTWGKYTKIT